jgi:hypothetical protein
MKTYENLLADVFPQLGYRFGILLMADYFQKQMKKNGGVHTVRGTCFALNEKLNMATWQWHLIALHGSPLVISLISCKL